MIQKQDLFSVAECAKYCGLTRGAFYMHYYRGHINATKLPTHKIYFTRDELDAFRENYVLHSLNIF